MVNRISGSSISIIQNIIKVIITGDTIISREETGVLLLLKLLFILELLLILAGFMVLEDIMISLNLIDLNLGKKV